MSPLTRALWAEMLKTKRTLALWLTIIIPLGIVALQFAIVAHRGMHLTGQAVDAWIQFGQQMFLFWVLLALPLFIALETALLGGIEQQGNQWKHLCVLPLPRWTLYAAKYLASMALIGVSMAVLVSLTVLAGYLLQVLRPGTGFADNVPWGRFCSYAGGVYLASWLVISIQTWVGLRWSSFVVPMSVAVAATILGMVIGSLDVAALYPWSLPMLVSDVFVTGEMQWPALLLGSLGGVVIAFLVCLDASHRDVS